MNSSDALHPLHFLVVHIKSISQKHDLINHKVLRREELHTRYGNYYIKEGNNSEEGMMKQKI